MLKKEVALYSRNDKVIPNESSLFTRTYKNDIIAIYNESGIKVAAYEYDAWE